ncbi:MAG: hypothetical protein AAF518_17765 [Spirochaetota bacterium]
MTHFEIYALVKSRGNFLKIAKILLGSLFPVLLICTSPILSTDVKTIQEGKLDLGNWDQIASPLVSLNGKWEFYWKQFLSKDFSQNQPVYIPLLPWRLLQNKYKIHSRGYATYRLLLLFPETELGKHFALKIPIIGTAYRLFINGVKKIEVGKVGISAATSRAKYSPEIVEFSPKRKEVEIVLHVSNFQNRDGGQKSPILLGGSSRVYSDYLQKVSVDLLLFGSLFTMGSLSYRFVRTATKRKVFYPFWYF